MLLVPPNMACEAPLKNCAWTWKLVMIRSQTRLWLSNIMRFGPRYLWVWKSSEIYNMIILIKCNKTNNMYIIINIIFDRWVYVDATKLKSLCHSKGMFTQWILTMSIVFQILSLVEKGVAIPLHFTRSHQKQKWPFSKKKGWKNHMEAMPQNYHTFS